MTLDEAIKHAEEVAEENQAIVDSCDYYGENMAKCEKCAEEHRQLAEWLKNYKRLLEQEPCEDATLKDIFCMGCEYKEQEPKTGQWKVVSDGYGDSAYICECSECKDTVWVYKDADRKWNYCPNCGAKMIDPQESEVNNG